MYNLSGQPPEDGTRQLLLSSGNGISATTFLGFLFHPSCLESVGHADILPPGCPGWKCYSWLRWSSQGTCQQHLISHLFCARGMGEAVGKGRKVLRMGE